MATHTSILAWNIPWREEPGRLQSIGLQTVRHDGAHTHISHSVVIVCQLQYFIIGSLNETGLMGIIVITYYNGLV